MEASGVDHIRDGALGPTEGVGAYYSELATTAAANIKVDGVISTYDIDPIDGAQARITQFIEANQCGTNQGCIDAIENVNEMDNNGYSLSEIQEEIPLVWNLVQATPSGYTIPPVYGPSLNFYDYQNVGNYASDMTYGNLHIYPATAYPGSPQGMGSGCGNYDTLGYDICEGIYTSGSLPMVATENGYEVGTGSTEVSAAVQLKYEMRMALLAFNSAFANYGGVAGFKKTYFFNLVDQPCGGSGCQPGMPAQTYGWLDLTFNKRPVYVGFANLLTKVLQDSPISFAATPLTYSLLAGGGGNLPSTVEHLLLQKHDHSWRLLLWLETPDTSPKEQTQSIQFSSPTSFKTITQYAWEASGSYTTNVIKASAGNYTFNISDRVSVSDLAP